MELRKKMRSLSRIDESLLEASKPSLQKFDGNLRGGRSCLLLCAGFEDRALALLKKVAAYTRSFDVCLIEYLPKHDGNRFQEGLSICREKGIPVHTVQYDRKKPAGFGCEVIPQLLDVYENLYIDISAMSRLLIVQLLVALSCHRHGFEKTIIIYSEALVYSPSAEEVIDAIAHSADSTTSVLLISSGIFDLEIVPELSAIPLGAIQSRLIFFPSFNPDQLVALRSELQPSRYTFIHGCSPRADYAWRIEAISVLNQLASVPEVEEFTKSTLRYEETLNCLLQIYQACAEREKIIIAPTGSKMQAVAVGLFRGFVNDTQIIYPTPRAFRRYEEYTHGVGAQYSLSLADFGSLRREMSS